MDFFVRVRGAELTRWYAIDRTLLRLRPPVQTQEGDLLDGIDGDIGRKSGQSHHGSWLLLRRHANAGLYARDWLPNGQRCWRIHANPTIRGNFLLPDSLVHRFRNCTSEKARTTVVTCHYSLLTCCVPNSERRSAALTLP